MSSRYFSPRLLDYVAIVGSRNPGQSDELLLEPEILRRYPSQNHEDFILPPDTAYFCQPEGCLNIGSKHSLRDVASFVFTLTEKDSGRRRYGTCINFYRPFKKKYHSRKPSVDHSAGASEVESLSGAPPSAGASLSPAAPARHIRSTQSHTLTSLCIISHHPCFSVFRECLLVLRKIINLVNRKQGTTAKNRNSIWNFLVGKTVDVPPAAIGFVCEIETWILKLLNIAVPYPGKVSLELHLTPAGVGSPLVLALPDHTRFSLVDFPLHLPIELLGVDLCIQALQCIMLEHKVVLQSKDYNALTMSILALVAFVYPLEYMFPVIPLLPSSMNHSEQLLMAPTPFIIGIPASFFERNSSFKPPTDIWLFDLDGSKVTPPTGPAGQLPTLPEPEGSTLKTHFKQAISTMNAGSEEPVKDLNVLLNASQPLHRAPSHTGLAFNPFIYGNDVDSIDVATRVAMVRFFCSPNVLGNVEEHLRILRLYPRPVVGFQLNSFIKSRPKQTAFVAKLACTQAVEFFMEWSLNPTNVTYTRVHTGVYDPVQIGDKPRWYSGQLGPVAVHLMHSHSMVGQALLTSAARHKASREDSSSDESLESDDETAASSSKKYSQKLTVCEAEVYKPPVTLQEPMTTSLRIHSGESSDEELGSGNSSTSEEEEVAEAAVHNNNIETNGPEEEKLAPTSVNPPDHECAQEVEKQTVNKVKPPRPPPPSRPKENHMGTDKQFGSKGSASSDSPISKITTFGADIGDFASSKIASLLDTVGDKVQPSRLGSTKNFPEAFPSPGPGSHGQTTDKPKVTVTPSKSAAARGESQAFLKDVVEHVLGGQGVSWLKQGRIKKLMEEENLRVFVLTRLYPQLESKLNSDDMVADVKLSKPCYKGMVSLLRLISCGLEQSFKHHCKGGLGSAFLLLQTAHTHYFIKESRSNSSSLVSSPFGSGDNLSSHLNDGQSLPPPSQEASSNGGSPRDSSYTMFNDHRVGSTNGKVFLPESPASVRSQGIDRSAAVDSSAVRRASVGGDMELSATLEGGVSRRAGLSLHGLGKDELIGSASNVLHLGSPLTQSPISHQSLRKVNSEKSSPTEGIGGIGSKGLRGLLDTSRRSQFGANLRPTNDKLSSAGSTHSDSTPRLYVYEGLIGKDRLHLWDYMQFWEDVFLDCVSQERELVGLDEDPSELLLRYQGLSESERRRLEQIEDRLLSTILYNLAAFMVMMNCSLAEVKRKVRRLLGKSHIGMLQSQYINNLLDNLDQLNGNDIDLKILPSRLQRKHSYSVHYGTSITGDMLFMDVCDDCVVLREVSGTVVDRWWYESLINITYCPKTHVLCLWRKMGEQTELNQFFAKKCRDLYTSVKEAMERVAASSPDNTNGPELGGEFPVHDVSSGQSGILQVCMEGIGLLLDNAKYFIELKRIKRCFTQKGGVFILEELDLETGEIRQRVYLSKMANQISYSVLCVFSYMATGMDETSS